MVTEIQGHNALSGQPLDDITEVSNYVDAMMYGLKSLRDPQGLPLSLRLIREIHGRLLIALFLVEKQ